MTSFGLTLTTAYEIRVSLEHNGQVRTLTLGLWQRTFDTAHRPRPNVFDWLAHKLQAALGSLLILGPLGA